MNDRDLTYIGDAVFAECDSYGIKLSVNRDGTEHWIYLEPSVYARLVHYAQGCFGGAR